jgi:hypothetical protein
LYGTMFAPRLWYQHLSGLWSTISDFARATMMPVS